VQRAHLNPTAPQSLGVLKAMTLDHLPAIMIEPLARVGWPATHVLQ
jgi:hypothetical protein